MILITGATGRLGKSLVPALLEKGYELRILAKEDETVAWNNVEVVRGEISDFQALDKACKNIDTVMHLAGIIDYRNKQLTDKVNYEGTRNVVNAALKNSVPRFIFMSSVSVYGKSKYLPMDENHPKNPQSCYGESKLLAENYVLASGLNCVVIRSPAIYGKDYLEGFSNILNAIKSGKMAVVGNGKNHIQFIHIDDCVQAFLLVLENKEANGVFNIAGPDVMTQEQIIALAAKIIGVDAPKKRISKSAAYMLARLEKIKSIVTKREPRLKPEFVSIISDDRYYDISRAKHILGFEPKVDYAQGIREVAKGFGLI